MFLSFLATATILLNFKGHCAESSGLATTNTSAGGQFRFSIAPAEEYNRLFYREDGWTGGDFDYSVPLKDGRILWLFGDSWVGSIRAHHHTNSTMVHSTVGIQRGLDPATARLDFFLGVTNGKPAAFMQPAKGSGYFWLSHGGIQTERGLYIFMSRIQTRPGDNSVWNFQSAGIQMAKVSNPSDSPDKWRVEQINVPAARFDSKGERSFGFPFVREGDHIYFYGLGMEHAQGNRYLLAGRVKAATLENFSTWEFYRDGLWQSDFEAATPLCDHMGAEFSVSWLPRFKRYVLVYTENGLSEKIMLRYSATPVGPWSAPVTIYKAPEVTWDKTYFCYAAKAHPELSRADDELLVTYVCNSGDFWKMAGDARIYFPKFLRLKIESIP